MITSRKATLVLAVFCIALLFACQNKKDKTTEAENANITSEESSAKNSENEKSEESSRCFDFESARFTIKKYNYKGELDETLHVVTSDYGERMRQDKTVHVTSERKKGYFTTYWKKKDKYYFITNKGEQYANTTQPDQLFIMEADSPPYPIKWAERYCRLDQNYVEQAGNTYSREDYLGVITDVYRNKVGQRETHFYKGLRMKETYVSDMGFQRKELVTKFIEGIPIAEEIITPPEKPEHNEPLEDDSTDKPCEFPDLSGVWACEGKGHFELRQTNDEIDGDCISYLEGKFLKYNCSDDLWTMSQDQVNYVRGKIINGNYTIEIFPKDNKKDIGQSRFRTQLSGTVEVGAEILTPEFLFGQHTVDPVMGSKTDPHSGESMTNFEWKAKPVKIEKKKCKFKKSSIYNMQEAGAPPCKKCKKQEIPKELSFDNGRFTNSDELEMRQLREGDNPRYAVGSGTAKESQGSGFYFVSDYMNTIDLTVPRFNLRIRNVERDGWYIHVTFEVCDWMTGKKITGERSYYMGDLSKDQLNLPDTSPIIQKEYRKAGAEIFQKDILKLFSGE